MYLEILSTLNELPTKMLFHYHSGLYMGLTTLGYFYPVAIVVHGHWESDPTNVQRVSVHDRN